MITAYRIGRQIHADRKKAAKGFSINASTQESK